MDPKLLFICFTVVLMMECAYCRPGGHGDGKNASFVKINGVGFNADGSGVPCYDAGNPKLLKKLQDGGWFIQNPNSKPC